MSPIKIVVDDRVRLPELPEAVEETIRAGFVHVNPMYGKSQKKDEPPTYRTWRKDYRGLSLPRGGMGRVRAALKKHGLEWEVSDERTWEHPEPGFPDHLRTERPYQTRMREAAEVKQNCILHGAVGGGKTTVLYSLISRLKRRTLVMVWTGGLLKQWRDRAVEELGMKESDVGIIQGNIERIEPLTICMQQTIDSRFERGDTSLVDQFDVLCCDEIQKMAAKTCYSAVDPFKARYRVGVSADHTRHDRKEFLIRDLFGDIAEEITEEETIAANATVDVEIYVVPTEFKANWYRYRSDFNLLLSKMTADEERNEIALKISKTVVEQGEQVLLFSHRVEHARTIDSRLVGMGIRSGALIGGKENEVAFDRAKAGFKSGDHRAGVGTYKAIAQGIDLPTVSRGVCMTPIGNNRQEMGQVRGRICRSSDGKDFGRLYYLLDFYIYGKKPVANFIKWFRTVRVWSGVEWVEGAVWLRSRGYRS